MRGSHAFGHGCGRPRSPPNRHDPEPRLTDGQSEPSAQHRTSDGRCGSSGRGVTGEGRMSRVRQGRRRLFVIAGVVGGLVIAGVVGGFAMGRILHAGAGLLARRASDSTRVRYPMPASGALTLLGEGGCRTADGEQGEHTNLKVSFDQCKAKCLAVNGQCTALEYNSNTNGCEIHSEPITSFEGVAGVSCYQR